MAQTLLEFIKAKGFTFTPEFSGEVQRFDRRGKELNGFAICRVFDDGVQWVRFGDFSTREQFDWWSSSHKKLTPEEIAALQAQIEANRKAYLQKKRANQELAAQKAWGYWQHCTEPLMPTAYEQKKGLQKSYGTRVDRAGNTIVPRCTVDGELRNLEIIDVHNSKKKRPIKHAQITGLFHTIGELSPETEIIYVCEGYATGASIYEALALHGVRQRGGAGILATPDDSAESGERQSAGRLRGSDAGEVRLGSRPELRGSSQTPEIRGSGELRDELGRREHYSAIGERGSDAGPGRAEQRGVHQKLAWDSSAEFEREEFSRAPNRDRESQNGLGAQSGGRETGSRRGASPHTELGRHQLCMGDLDQIQSLSVAEIRQMGGFGRAKEAPARHGASQSSDTRAVGASLGAHDEQGRDRGGSADRQQRARHGNAHHLERPESDPRPAPRSDTKPQPHLGSGESGGPHQPPGSTRRAGGADGHEPPDGDAAGAPNRFAVACSFVEGNLKHVAKALRKAYPSTKIVVAGDNDAWTDVAGKKVNPGRLAAEESARVIGARCVLPRFDGVDNLDDLRPTDFNDLAALLGLEVVSRQLNPDPKASEYLHLSAIKFIDSPPMTAEYLEQAARELDSGLQSPPSESGELYGVDISPHQSLQVAALSGVGVTAPPPAFESLATFNPRTGGMQAPPQQDVANALLEAFAGHMVKQEKDIFRYTGTHWEWLNPGQMDRLKQQAQQIAGGLASAKTLESIVELFRIHLPSVPPGRNLFIPDPWTVNFQNGTLHVEREGQGYRKRFTRHAREDFITNTLPFNYDEPGKLPTNTEFEAMLYRVFEGDADADEKRRALAQMYGACLLPAFPHLFMLHGKPGTGKSTAIKIAARLLSDENISRVQPCDFKGFDMETMAGKLANIVTDIKVNQPIQDDMVKQVEDRIPFRIKRKYLKDIYAPLPSVHIFGGNNIPPTLEGASRAHDRRWTFLGFDRSMLSGADTTDKDYSNWCFDQGPLGVLQFALRGLDDLLALRGWYSQPASGTQAMEEWQLNNDPVGRFLRDIEEGEKLDDYTTCIMAEEARIERKKLWSLYTSWFKESAPSGRQSHKNRFYQAIEERGFKVVVIQGIRCFKGIGLAAFGDGVGVSV